jgi:hypothetical protein
LLAAGFNQGNWNGPGGIVSRTAAAEPNRLTTLGSATNADLHKTSFAPASDLTSSDVLVKYTYYGDVDLSGNFTMDDFTLFLGGYQTAKTTWLAGDFDYDGSVTLDDFTQVLAGYQRQGTQL